MTFKTHPLLKDLQINEDGSVLLWKGLPLEVKEYQRPRDNYKAKLVNCHGKTHRLTKLICEAWNGPRDTMDQVVKRRDFNPNNYHYTNLYWASQGGSSRTKKQHRPSNAKINESDIDVIIERIKHNEPLATIAKDFKVSSTVISRLKERFITNPKMVLREKIMRAKDGYYRQLAFANYFGFKTVAEAVKELGKTTFILQSKSLQS